MDNKNRNEEEKNKEEITNEVNRIRNELNDGILDEIKIIDDNEKGKFDDGRKKEGKGEEEQKNETKPKSNEQIIIDLTNNLQRLQAEFENYKKRSYKERCDFLGIAEEDFALSLVPFIESLESALANEKTEEHKKSLQILYKQLIGILEKKGFKEINPINQKYDPYLHEAILTQKAEEEKQKGKIVQVLQKGYMLNNKVIRHPKVKINN